MPLIKGTVNGQPVVVLDSAPSVPVTNLTGDGGDIVASAAAWIALNRTILDATEEAFTSALKVKLDNIATGADVTNATNVAAAGAVMFSATSTAGMGFGIDEDNMASNSPTKFPSQQSVKAYVDASITGSTVSEVNGKTGAVTLDADDIDASASRLWFTSAEQSKLTGIESNATADQSPAEIVAAYTSVVPVASLAEMQAGSETDIRQMSPKNIADAIVELASGSSAVSSVNGLTGPVTLNADNIGETASRIWFTTAQQTKLTGIEANATADLTGNEIVNLIGTELGNDRWQSDFDTLGTVYNLTKKLAYEPASDSDSDRAAAFSAAHTAAADGDRLRCGSGFTYEFSSPMTVNKSIVLLGNCARFTRPDGTQTNQILILDSPSGGFIRAYDLEIDGNAANVEIVGSTNNRCEGLKVDGAGRVDVYNFYAHDAPVIQDGQSTILDDAAVNFLIAGSGHKRFFGCTADNPSYANYRIQARSSEFICCNSYNTVHSGNKGRFWAMDGAAVRSCYISGGTWQTDQAYEINANFDPTSVSDSSPDANWCESLVIDNVYMDFGTNHVNTTTDSFIKFDNVRKVICTNIIQTHSTIFQRNGTNPTTAAGTGFKWWNPSVGVKESLFTVGSLCKSAYFENVIADGWLDLAGSSGGPYTDLVVVRNCEWGVNAHINHAVENGNHAKMLVLENSSFHNIIGSGTNARYIIYNPQSDNSVPGTLAQRQQIRVSKCFFSTFWGASVNAHSYLASCKSFGEYAGSDVDILDKNTDEYFAKEVARGYFLDDPSNPAVAASADNYITYGAPYATDRLHASPQVGDPYTGYVGRPLFRRYNYTTDLTGASGQPGFDEGDLHSTTANPGITFTDTTYLGASSPATVDGDWFNGHIRGPEGCRIINLLGGYGGNGRPMCWYLKRMPDASLKWINDPAIRMY